MSPGPNMKKSILSILSIAALAACGTPEAPPSTPPPAQDTVAAVPVERPAVVAPANSKIQLVAATPAAAFPGAKLVLDTMLPDAKKMQVAYKYQVRGFDLKAQTPDATTRGCANSADGQHIHFILNNAPYKAEYTADFTEKAMPGRNVVLSFLSRSYHESLKDNAAVVLRTFTMPGTDSLAAGDVTKDPTLFYSRPKGDYKKLDGDKVLLDFYLVNTDLEKDGYSVRATIDGNAWTINKWDAYFIEGMELGMHTVRLQLLDAKGDPAPGPFNDSGTREFNYLGS